MPASGAGEVGTSRMAGLDGTKIKANASKHKAMSCERMGGTEKKLEAEVKALLAEAARVDAEEDRWPTRPNIAPHPALRDPAG